MPGSTVPLAMFFVYILSFCISPHNRSSSSSLKVKSLKLQIGSEETFWRAMETIWKCKPAVSQFHGFPLWPQPPPPHKVLLSAQIEVVVKMEIIKRTKQEKNIEIDTGNLFNGYSI